MTTNFISRIFAKRVTFLIVLGILIAGGLVYSRIPSQTSTDAKEGSTLQTAVATVGDLVLYANGTGVVSPIAETSPGFNASGQVSEIFVRVGDQVEAGDVLAELDDTNAKIELAEEQEAMNKVTSAAAISTAKQTLAEAQSSLEAAKDALEYLISPEVLYWEERVAEREQVLADAQAVAQTDSSEEAIQQTTEAERSLKYAKDTLSHIQEIYKTEYVRVTFTQYRTMTFRGRTWSEPVTIEDEETGEKSILIYPPSEGEIATARAEYELAKASVGEAQTYLNVLNGAEIPEGATGVDLVAYLEAKHALETAKYDLNTTKLIAPISGTVTALDINIGDLAASQSSVATISDLEQPYVLDAYLDAEDWGHVQIGYEVEVTFDILPDQVFSGTVIEVYPTLDTSSDSALVRITARLDDTIVYELPAGAAAAVDVVGGRTENAVLVPVEALHEIGDGQYALFVVENGKPRLRLVEVGLQDLTKAEIISGLNAGDIVTTGVVETQ